MRPVLAPSRHNKIPLSVRQVCGNLLFPLDRNLSEYMSYYKRILFLLGLLFKFPFNVNYLRMEMKIILLFDFG